MLKINIQLKPESFLLRLMNRYIEKTYGRLFLYMASTVRLLFEQRWADSKIPTMEE